MYQRLPVRERAGLIGYWTMDQANERMLMDRSGNGNHGLLVGDVDFVTFPRPVFAAPAVATTATMWGSLKKR